MNTTFDDIESQFKALDNYKTEDDFINEDAYVLQATYLSEIERLYKNEGLNRKKLAQKIHISPSYLTQIFRGDKPLNFITLAKIKRALNLRFSVTAKFADEKKTEFVFNAPIPPSWDRLNMPMVTTTNGDGMAHTQQPYNSEFKNLFNKKNEEVFA